MTTDIQAQAYTQTEIINCPNDFDYAFMLDFIEPRIIKGVESVADDVYSRSFRFSELQGEPPKLSKGLFCGLLQVSYLASTNQLKLDVSCDHIAAFPYVLQRVKYMFDLEADMQVINQALQSDPVLQKGFINGFVPRMPKAFDSFEFCVRAVLGQQVSVKAATTLASRVAHAANLVTPNDFPDEIDCFFPQCADLLNISFEGLGLTQSRIATLETVIDAIHTQQVSLDKDQVFEDYLTQWTSLKGVGPWTANYLSMRGLGIQDSFPDRDLGVLKALANNGVYPSRKQVLEQAKAWQPFRAYATLCLWNGLGA